MYCEEEGMSVSKISTRRTMAVSALAAVLVLAMVAPAFAAVRIYVNGRYAANLGVGAARLSKTRTYNIAKLGSRSYTKRDTSYRYVVYLDCWGRKIATGRNRGKYPLHMWSKKAKDGSFRAFQFTCYTASYVTSKNIKVGSTASAVRAAYGSALKSRTTPTYTIYTLNSAYRWRTDFYVPRSGASTGRVSHISMWMY